MNDFTYGDLVARQGTDVRAGTRFVAWHPEHDVGAQMILSFSNSRAWVGVDLRVDEYVKLTRADVENIKEMTVVLLRNRAHTLNSDDSWQMAWQLHQAGWRVCNGQHVQSYYERPDSIEDDVAWPPAPPTGVPMLTHAPSCTKDRDHPGWCDAPDIDDSAQGFPTAPDLH